jgi:hypothetical protein
MSNSPLNKISSQYTNIDNSHIPFFTSRNNSHEYGNAQIVNNVEAANASRYSGGQRKRRRIKSKRRMSLHKKKTNKRKRKRRTLRGGYNFNPYALINQNGGLSSVTNCNFGYSTGGENLPSKLLGMANPVIFKPNTPNLH